MSKYYNKVKLFYDKELWSLDMVCNAIGRWITEEEFIKITGKENDELSR